MTPKTLNDYIHLRVVNNSAENADVMQLMDQHHPGWRNYIDICRDQYREFETYMYGKQQEVQQIALHSHLHPDNREEP